MAHGSWGSHSDQLHSATANGLQQDGIMWLALRSAKYINDVYLNYSVLDKLFKPLMMIMVAKVWLFGRLVKSLPSDRKFPGSIPDSAIGYFFSRELLGGGSLHWFLLK